MNERWPRPPFDEEQQPHFLFIITPPFSGATVLAELLNSSPRITLLQEQGEGQWLVPGLSADERWNGSMEVDYGSVKAVWLNTFQSIRSSNPMVEVVVEKSPPNMVRIEALAQQFRTTSFLANNRDPYANCAGILYRNHQAAKLNEAQRMAILARLAADWLKRSAKIRELVCRLDIPLLTYEEFCETPSALLNKLALPAGVAASMDARANVRVKDYPLQGIVDQNKRQTGLLADEEIALISQILQTDKSVPEFFSYEVLK